jgi:hypothetical protein
MLFIFDIYSIATLIIYLLFIYKLRDHNCECSDNWKRKFILITTYIFLVTNIIFASVFLSKVNLRSTIISYYVLIVLNIIYTIIVIIYITNLKNNKCACSHVWEREYMYITALISAVLFCISILTVIVVAITHKNLRLNSRNIIPNYSGKKKSLKNKKR